MKKKRKLIHRVGVFVCALVVAVSLFGSFDFAFANVSREDSILECGLTLPDTITNEHKILLFKTSSGYTCIAIKGAIEGDMFLKWYSGSSGKGAQFIYDNYSTIEHYVYYTVSNNVWTLKNEYFDIDYSSYGSRSFSGIIKFYPWDYSVENHDLVLSSIKYSDFDIYTREGDDLYDRYGWPLLVFDAYENVAFDSNLGYLQNVHVNHVFEEAPLGETVNDKWVSRWYFDTLSTTDLDLSSGNYSINYYEERWIVTGYEENDVVEKSDRYLLGTYNASDGYFATNSQHIEEFLQGKGYEKPNFFDLWFDKFVTTHYYLQIVDNTTNEVGGYVHIYLTDDNGSFGVELIGETIDENGNIDDSGYSDFINEGKITTDDTDAGFEELENDNEQTVEEWFERYFGEDESDVLNDVDGSADLLNYLVVIGQEVNSFSLALGQFFGALPLWVSVSFGIGVSLLFLSIIVKILGG